MSARGILLSFMLWIGEEGDDVLVEWNGGECIPVRCCLPMDASIDASHDHSQGCG